MVICKNKAKKILFGVIILRASFDIYNYCTVLYNEKPKADFDHFLGGLFHLIIVVPISGIFKLITYIPYRLYILLDLPKKISYYSIIILIFGLFYFYTHLMEEKKDKEEKDKEEKLRIIEVEKTERERIEEIEKIEQNRKEEKLRLEKIEYRKKIISEIINNNYKDTEREVNNSLLPTLSIELQSIYKKLKLNKKTIIIEQDNDNVFQEKIFFLKKELERLKKIGIKSQNHQQKYNQNNSLNNDNKMTKDKALDILEIKDAHPIKSEINKAYRTLVIKYNTDQRAHYEEHVRKMLEEKFKEINNAKDYLDKHYS